MPKKRIIKRICRIFFRLIFAVFLLGFIIVFFILINLKSLVLDIIRLHYPDVIINIENVAYKFPLRFVAKNVYLRHIEDTSALSDILIPELDINLNFNFQTREISVKRVIISNYSMKIDKTNPDAIIPLIAFAVSRNGSSDDSIMRIDEISLENGRLSIIGLNYDIQTGLNINIHTSVKKDKGYDISGSLKDFKAVSYDFQTMPLNMEFETSINSFSFSKPLDIGRMRVLVNDIPAELTGEISSVENGYKVVANVVLASKPVKELLALFKYKIPVVSDFDIESPAEIKAKIVYDPDAEEFINIAGAAQIEYGRAKSNYYGITAEGLRAFLPFKYAGTMVSYLWIVGGNMPEYGIGTISSDLVKYDRYNVENINTAFVYDGTITQFMPLTMNCYNGVINGSISVFFGTSSIDTKIRFNIDGLDIAKLLDIYQQKKFEITGIANGTAEIDLTNNYIKNMNVRMKTENGVFAVEDIGKSLSALPGGDFVAEQIKRQMGKPEYWDEFVKTLKNYPYEQGKINVVWESLDKGSIILDLWLKGEKPKPGTLVSFPTVPITIGYHGIKSLTDIFNIDKILKSSQNK